MDFGQQVKIIRKKEHLTQEQFAEKLSVTRQAISNWENNKNLPDIGVLIQISDVFNVSLDTLIKGDSGKTPIAEKIIKDGSENKRARYNMINTMVGALFIAAGIVCLAIRAILGGNFFDAAGIRHEQHPFLIPVALMFIACGCFLFLTIGIRLIFGVISRKQEAKERQYDDIE